MKYEAPAPDVNAEPLVYLYKNPGNHSAKALGFQTDGIKAKHTDTAKPGSPSVIPFDFSQYQGEWKHYVLSVAPDITSGVGFDFYVDGVHTSLATSSLDFIAGMSNFLLIFAGFLIHFPIFSENSPRLSCFSRRS